MRLDTLLSLMVFAVISAVSHAEVYQWTDEHGTTHFSDKPISSDAKKLNIDLPAKHETKPLPVVEKTKPEPVPDPQVKNEQTDLKSSKDKPVKETQQENTKKSREELTEELIKAREIREAKRKQQKEAEELQLIKCQEEKTKLALMKNEVAEYDKKLKNMSRSERPKSNEYIKKTDLETRMKRQKDITYELCN